MSLKAIKDKIIKNAIKLVEDIKVSSIKIWLSACNFVFGFYVRTRKIVTNILILSVLAWLIFLLFTHYEQLNGYLCGLCVDSSGNLTDFFSTLFVTIGASVLGVLAITFSLSLFAIQQAADKHTPTVLASFLKDKTNNLIFWSIGIIAIFFFLFAVFPLKEFIFIEVISTFSFIIFVLFLLKKQYAHITKLVNPMHQIIFRHNEAIEELSKIDKWLNLMIRIGAIRPGNQGNQQND